VPRSPATKPASESRSRRGQTFIEVMVPVDHQAVSCLYGKAAGALLKRGLAGFAASLTLGRVKVAGRATRHFGRFQLFVSFLR
jgi:hypothetical protein